MISQKLVPWLFLIVFSLLVVGCAKPSDVPGTPSHATPTLASSATSKPIVTFTATPSSTPTVIPTLPVEDARLELLNLLANNGNCRLPCLWGITPGKSTVQEAQSILAPLSSISDRTHLDSSPGTMGLNYTEGDLQILTTVTFLANPNDNIISSMSFYAQALREISQGNYEQLFGDPLYDQLLKAYSLPQILTTYGIPADVLIRTNSESPPQNWGPFEILVSYPEQGVLVHYTIPLDPVGPNIVGCPTKSKLELYLVPSGMFNSTDELLESRAAPLKIEELFPGFRSIEEVTSFSLDEFVSIFSQPTDQCIETLASYWPTP